MTPADALPPLPMALQTQLDRVAAELLQLMRYPAPGLRVIALVRAALLAEDALSQTLRQIRADRLAAVEAMQAKENPHG